MRISKFAASWGGAIPLALAVVLSLPNHAKAASSADGAAARRRALQTIPAGLPVPPALGGPIASARRQPLNAKLKTPFESRLAPQLQQVLKTSASARSVESAASTDRNQTQTPKGSSPGSNQNFPSFVAAPFFTLTNPADGSAPSVAVTGDFNGDGKPDVAIVQSGGSLTCILNPGSYQNFSSVPQLPPNETFTNPLPRISSAFAVDMDKDGKLDIVAADAGNNNILIWPGNGDGTFGAAVVYPVAPAAGGFFFFGGGIVVGDFNGDGSPDVVAFTTAATYYPKFSSTLTFQTFVNDGKGNLIEPKTELDANFNDVYEEGVGQMAVVSNDGVRPSGIAFLVNDIDLNHTGHSGTNVLYIASNGDGTFSAPIEPTAAAIPGEDGLQTAFSANNSLFAANLSARAGTTGQPTTDIVFVTGDGAVYDAPYSPGSDSFTVAAPSVLAGANVYVKQAPVSSKNGIGSVPIPYANSLNLSDINKDGATDLVVYAAGSAYVFPNKGNHTFGAPTQLVGGAGATQQPQPADYEGSGYNSFVWLDDALSEVGYYRNLGGQFYAAPPISGPSYNGLGYDALSSNIQVQATGDFDGDGLQDVVAYDLTDLASNSGYPDLVVGFNNGNKNTANEISNFTFTTVVPAATLIDLDIGYVEPFTVKSANSVSLVMISNAGSVYLVTDTGNGAFGAPTALIPGTPLNCEPSYGDAGDVNGDGIQDIVLSYPGDASCGGSGSTPSGLLTFLGNHDGTFQAGTLTQLGNSLYMAKLINFNGKAGSSDVVAIDNDRPDGIYSVYTVPNAADGTGTFNVMYGSTSLSGYIVSDIVPGDFNNDGKQDLTLTTEGQYVPGSFAPAENTMGVLLLPFKSATTVFDGTNTYPAFYTFSTPTLVNTDFYSVWGAYADFNGDGYPDLAIATVNSQAGFENPFRAPPAVPLVQILPNQGGYFGPVLTEIDSSSAVDPFSVYLFTGNFGNTGGNDLLVTGSNGTAEFLNQGANSIALAASATNPAQGVPVTFAVTLSQNVTGYAATGTVTFTVNGQSLGAADLLQNTATLTTAALPVGVDTVTASYSGDAFHNASRTTVNVTVAAASPTFTLTASGSSLNLKAGATGTVSFQVAANGTFNGSISFACAGAPSESTCTVTPSSVSLGSNQSNTVTVVVATTAPNNSYHASRDPVGHAPWLNTAGRISVAFLLILLPGRRRRLSGGLAALVLSLGAVSLLSGCSNNGGSKPPAYAGTPAGQSMLTITATSGSITQTQTIALTIPSAQ